MRAIRGGNQEEAAAGILVLGCAALEPCGLIAGLAVVVGTAGYIGYDLMYGPAEVGPQVIVNSQREPLNLPGFITPERAKHILEGDRSRNSGGHRHGTGLPGKTEFPEHWTDQDIIDGIEDIYLNGEIDEDLPDLEGGSGFIGEHRGIRIEVVVDEDGQVVTGYPSPGQEDKGVVENPPE